MEYRVVINGNSYELPRYSIKISDKFEATEKLKQTCTTKRAFEEMYNVVASLVGKKETEDAIGKFINADPNAINIAYLSIIDAYNKPLADYQMSKKLDMLDNEVFQELRQLMDGVKNVASLAEKKND